MDKKDAQQILLNIGNDGKEAFSRLFLAYYEKLVQFALHIVFQTDIAEDVVADVFSKLWVRRHHLSSVNNVEAYLYTSVKNGCFDQRKLKQRMPAVKEMQLDNIVPVEDRELQTVLKDAIRALPEQRRLVFLLIKENGKTAIEVAEILGISVRTVENHLYKAVKTLAGTISHYLGYDPKYPTGNQKRSNLLFFFL
jgi:RNA polymerase sigma-70 factor (family 1)